MFILTDLIGAGIAESAVRLEQDLLAGTTPSRELARRARQLSAERQAISTLVMQTNSYHELPVEEMLAFLRNIFEHGERAAMQQQSERR